MKKLFTLLHRRLLWQGPVFLLLFVVISVLANEYAFARASRRTKDVAYVSTNAPDFDAVRHLLDVYAPKQPATVARPVVMFIHGGAWNSGSKNLYSFVGRRLAKHGIVAVLINYRLSPGVQVPAMASDCARAMLWVTQHITDYGGDPARIFVMGHSAGGGLAALLATDDRLFAKLGLSQNPVKGAILDDPGGLDMFDYLQKMEYPGDEQYLVPFGKNFAVWRDVSPLYFLKVSSPSMLIYVGERTYPSIASSTRKFNKQLLIFSVNHEFTVLPGKKHVGMVTQLFWKNNIIYRDLLRLVEAKVR